MYGKNYYNALNSRNLQIVTMSRTIKIGVLVLQGAFAEHEFALQQCLQCNMEEFKDLELNIVKIRRPGDLQVYMTHNLVK